MGSDGVFTVGASMAVTLVLMPQPTIHLGLGLGYERRWIGIEFNGFVELPRDILYEDPPGVGAKVWLAGGAAAFCPGWRADKIHVAGCLAFELGVMSASGFGARNSHRESFPWVASVAGARLAWAPSGPIRLFLKADVVVPLIHSAVGISGLPELYRVPAVGTRLGAAIAVTFGDRPRRGLRRNRG